VPLPDTRRGRKLKFDNRTDLRDIADMMKNKSVSRVAIQCICPDTGVTGTFLFGGPSHRLPGSRISPVCVDFAALVPWCRANGWVQVQCDATTWEKCHATAWKKS
jgi:hypothetical protein